MTRMTWAVCGVVALRNLACCGLRRAAFVCFAWLVLVAWPTTRGEPNVGLSDALADAELTDLFFLDPEHGWAVGDRGAIWSTSDGGRQWRRRESPSGCRWESVWFADSQHGWIVGGWHQPATGQSRGAVLRTRDGGQNWMPVPASTLPRLLKVRFSDSQRGWAVGEPTPLYPTGVFRSEDGGRSWAPVPGPACGQWLTGDWLAKPGRTRLGIVAGRHGSVAQLAADGLAPQVVPAASGRSIRAITLATATEPQRGFPSWLVGDDGLVLSSYDGGRSWLEPPTPPPLACGQVDWRGVAALDGRVWIVGDPGSVVLHSADGGESWQLLRTDESAPLRSVRFFDRQRGWAVGALGQILATRDGGQTWKRAQGRGRVALLGLFSDESRLPLELFAQTAGNDGYLAVAELLFHRDPTSASGSPQAIANLPANLSANATTNEPANATANATANVTANATATVRAANWLGHTGRHSLSARVHAALLEVGASGGGVLERFPVEDRGLEPTAEQLVAAWNERYEGRGFERLVEQLTTKLRTWRPEVVVTEDTVGDGADALTGITRQAVLAAVQRAADPRALSASAKECGLSVWQVKKVYGQVATNDRGGVALNSMQLAPRLARPLGDVAARGRWQLEMAPRPPPPSLSFRLILNVDGLTPSRRDIMDGIALPAGSDGRRELSPNATRADVTDLARIAQRQRTLQKLLLRNDVGGAWLAQLDTLAQGTGNQSAGELYWQLGQRMHEAGRSTIAFETWALLATRLPHHELADAAHVRLLEQLASGEQRHRGELAARERLTQAAPAAVVAIASASDIEPRGGLIGAGQLNAGQLNAGQLGGGQLNAGQLNAEPSTSNQRLEAADRATGRGARAATPRVVVPATFETQGRTLDDTRVPGEKFAKTLEQTRPALFADPAMRLVWLAALRAGGRRADIETLLRTAARPQWPEPAAQALADEWWLLQADDRPGGKPPRPTVDCPLAVARPRLDGRLDDALWATAAVCPLQPSPSMLAVNAGSATARIARDREFLYLSATCQRLPNPSHATTADTGPRTRDAMLEGRDRVEFLIDVDRDYRTAFRLMCDERGWTFESAAEDASWNPTWYVAAARDDDTWTIEAAISWDELTRSPPVPGTVWALGVQRIAPGHGAQSWTGAPVSTRSVTLPSQAFRRTQTESSPAAFGWIRFE